MLTKVEVAERGDDAEGRIKEERGMSGAINH